MGIVVQRLLDPEVSGVLFTRHPVTGADERVIEATWGLGEAVVQGLVTPDRYRLSPTGEVLERSPGRKQVAIRARPRAPPPGSRWRRTWSRRSASTTVGSPAFTPWPTGARRRSEGPSDLEWAFADTDLHLLQRRAITAAARGALRGSAH